MGQSHIEILELMSNLRLDSTKESQDRLINEIESKMQVKSEHRVEFLTAEKDPTELVNTCNQLISRGHQVDKIKTTESSHLVLYR